MRISDTLSQVGLAMRLARSTTWIRNRGDVVSGTNGNGECEIWTRMEFGNGRNAGYKLSKIEQPTLNHAESGDEK